jgi:hypothetical protein
MSDDDLLGILITSGWGLAMLWWLLTVNLKPEHLCQSCGTIAKPRKVVPGSFLIEVLLLFFFIVPALFYTGYRLSKKYWCCPTCGSRDIIPKTSPNAVKTLAETKELIE